MRLLTPLIPVLAASCAFAPTPTPIVQTVIVERVVTATPEVKPTDTPRPQIAAKPTEIPTRVWTGKTFTVETKNLNINYPDLVNPTEARKHADTLQNAYETYLVIFAFSREQPLGGQKTTVVFDPQAIGNFTDHNRIVIGSVTLSQIREGYLNPPDRTFVHEMAHVFEYAQIPAGRYYIFNLIIGINEALAEYFVCYPGIFKLWAQDARANTYCDLVLRGIGAKSPEFTLAYYEAEKIDPYTLDWGEHPPGKSGEVYFEQMLSRVSDKCGWNVWQKIFAVTKESGGSPAAKKAYETKAQGLRDPLVKKAFADLVAGLSQACGQDLAPMFRAWRFDL